MKKFIVSTFFVVFQSCLCLTQSYGFTLGYQKHIDFFNFIDNLSNWSPGFTSSRYQIFWESEGLQQPNDLKHLESIRKIRNKYFHPKPSIFIHYDESEDPIAEAFYNAPNLQSAINKLEEILPKTDAKELISALIYFEPKVRKYTNDNTIIRNALNDILQRKDINDFYKKVSIFYNCKIVTPNKLKIHAVSLPPNKNISAFILNNTIIVSLPTSATQINEKMLAEFSSIIAHELMHFHSMNTPKKIQIEHEKSLIQLVHYDLKNQENYNLLIEEPLAVILGQKIFMKKFFPKHYNVYENVYSDPWVRIMSFLLEPLVAAYIEQTLPIDYKFIEAYASLSNQVINAHKSLAKN